jgi:hypothetical protein
MGPSSWRRWRWTLQSSSSPSSTLTRQRHHITAAFVLKCSSICFGSGICFYWKSTFAVLQLLLFYSRFLLLQRRFKLCPPPPLSSSRHNSKNWSNVQHTVEKNRSSRLHAAVRKRALKITLQTEIALLCSSSSKQQQQQQHIEIASSSITAPQTHSISPQ